LAALQKRIEAVARSIARSATDVGIVWPRRVGRSAAEARPNKLIRLRDPARSFFLSFPRKREPRCIEREGKLRISSLL
jgi:hypothetical protein